ncbi:MAG: ABC transporter ATP-binding protein [Sedimentisphaerales bacterium]|nr:ABC transporter ATP-binding protein [Sedimentisphaerales bacterium]
MSIIVDVKNLSFGYTKRLILTNLSFEVSPGSFLAIVGPNGSGKTTLLNLLCGQLKPASGHIEIDSQPIASYSIRKLAQRTAVVRQEFVPVFDFTVLEVVSMARSPYLSVFGFEKPQDEKLVKEALEMTETADFAGRPLVKLSGGERQRVFIARALAQDSPILLLDEPTAFLDLRHQVDIYDLLKKMQTEKSKTIIAVTHDVNLAAQYCDQTLLLTTDGSYCFGATDDVLVTHRLEKTYGTKIFAGKIRQKKFFIPLGKLGADRNNLTS